MGFKIQIQLEFDHLDAPPTKQDVHDYLNQLMEDDEVAFELILPQVSDYELEIHWSDVGEILTGHGCCWQVITNAVQSAGHVEQIVISACDPETRTMRTFSSAKSINRGIKNHYGIEQVFRRDDIFSWVSTILDKRREAK